MKEIKSLYLHFPFCRHLCNYCDFFKSIKKNDQQIDEFHDLFLKMDRNHQELLKSNDLQMKSLETLYIGGGTPSLWGSSGANFLKNWLNKSNISLREDCEFTLEVNPGAWTEESLNSFKSVGVNRFSLGIQSLDPRFLKIIDRIHGIEDVHTTLKKFNEMNANFSVDFMIGLPFSEKYSRDIIGELEEILSYGPSHISLYILTVPKHYKYHSQLPSEEWISEEYIKVSNFLGARGFRHYEVSNFALEGKKSIHNLNYWKMESVAALGPSATGFFSNTRFRYKWSTTKAEPIIESLNTDEFELEKLYMNLRSSLGFEVRTEYWGDLEKLVEQLIERGQATRDDSRFYLTSAGFLILDSVMDEIFKIIK